MPLSKAPIKTAILNVLNSNMDNTNAANSRDAFAQALTDAVADAVKNGIEGSLITLTSPSGPVTGTITLTVTP